MRHASAAPSSTVVHDPALSFYRREDVARLFGLSLARVAAWERAGLARPSAEDRGDRRYTFQDLVVVRAARDLVARGVPVARIRRALDAVRRSLPPTAPLSDLRILSDGTRVVVRDAFGTFDPSTGQLLLDFDVGTLRDDVVRALPARSASRHARTAYDHYLDGCRLDHEDATRERAEAAYRRALRLDPTLACAMTNLGMLRLELDDRTEAEALFVRAMQLDASQPEAPYNLGCIHLDRCEYARAVPLLARATELDADFADAHVNLAIALEALDRRPDALPHWNAYLALAPDGPYAAQAQQRVGSA